MHLKGTITDNIIGRKLIITRDGIKIGFFSILGKDAVKVAPKLLLLLLKNKSPSPKKW